MSVNKKQLAFGQATAMRTAALPWVDVIHVGRKNALVDAEGDPSCMGFFKSLPVATKVAVATADIPAN
ncbi:hypothetical protein N9068_01490 [bacterium]|nr:hypothetical protein [bacterium]